MRQTTRLLLASVALVNDGLPCHELVVVCLVQRREVDVLEAPQERASGKHGCCQRHRKKDR